MIKKYKVGIIGAGNIAALFEQNHAHAYSLHPNFKICGFIDIDYKKAQVAAQKWGGKAYSNLAEFLSKERPEIISVCTPDETHTLIVKQLKDSGIIGGILEKPLAPNLAQAETLVQALPAKSKFLVNYSRLFVPEFIKLKHQITAGAYGNLLAGTGYYGKGLVHNGSHLLGLLLWFFGKIRSVKKIREIEDFTPVDPSISAGLTFENGNQCIIQAVDRQYYSLFELDLLFEKGRVRIIDSGFKIATYKVVSSQKFKGHSALIRQQVIITSLDHSLELAVANLFDWLKEKRPPLSTVNNALDIQTACALIARSK